MRIALVGNNDGPLILAQSMRKVNRYPVCIGLQNPVSETLHTEYQELIGNSDFFVEFNEAQLLEQLVSYNFDILVNCFCNFKFNKLLDTYTVLNVHLAPLPEYRGRHPLQWALINGEHEFGCTVHKMDKAFDAGEIYWQEKVSISQGMSVAELRNALMEHLASGFGAFLGSYEKGNIVPLPNPDAKATYAPKRHPKDSLLTEWHDGDTVYRKVMALRSGDFPAYIEIQGKVIPFYKAKLEEETGPAATTVHIHRVYEDAISVTCKDGKRVRLYSFELSAHQLTKNQEIL